MNDDQILERGGTEEDIARYAELNGADLTEGNILIQEAFEAGIRLANTKIRKHLNGMLRELQTRKWNSVDEVDQFFIDNLKKYSEINND